MNPTTVALAVGAILGFLCGIQVALALNAWRRHRDRREHKEIRALLERPLPDRDFSPRRKRDRVVVDLTEVRRRRDDKTGG